MTTDEARNEYRNIMRRSGQTAAVFNAAVAAIVAARTPEGYVKAAKAVTFHCERCYGTGKWAQTWVMSLDGEMHAEGATGVCYRCGGKGCQNDADRRRNFGADLAAMARG